MRCQIFTSLFLIPLCSHGLALPQPAGAVKITSEAQAKNLSARGSSSSEPTDDEGSRNDGRTLLQTLQRHYSRAPPTQPVELGKTIEYKKVDLEYKSLLTSRWTAEMANTPLNAEVAAMVQKALSLLDNEWKIARGSSVQYTVLVDGQFSAYISIEVIRGDDFKLQADKLEWTGTTFPDSAFYQDVGVGLLDRLTESIKQKASQSGKAAVPKGSKLDFSYKNVAISLLLDSTTQAAWPVFSWDDLEISLEMFDDKYQKRRLWRDTWLQISYKGQSGGSVPIGWLTLIDKEDLSPDEPVMEGTSKLVTNNRVETS